MLEDEDEDSVDHVPEEYEDGDVLDPTPFDHLPETGIVAVSTRLTK